MKYSNGFTINATGAECFITFLANRPQGQTKTTEEVETIIMSEACARQLIAALANVYAQVDKDRAAKKANVQASESHKLS